MSSLRLWDQRFMALAQQIATWSKDRSRQTSCIIVGPNREIRATGYNGFPRGANDDVDARHSRENDAKYKWTEHAERNAIYNAARIGTALNGCAIYMPWYPCADCARAIIQSGIVEVIAVAPNWHDPKWAADFAMVTELFEDCGTHVRFVEGIKPPEIK